MEKYQPGQKILMLSRDETRAFDKWAINELGIPGVVLMENAGRGCAELIAGKLSKIEKPQVCIFCGTGNNGGDGFVIARHLLNRQFGVVVVICGDRNKIKGDAKINLDIIETLSVKIETIDMGTEPNVEGRTKALARDADMIVDAIFGTGLTGELREEYKRLIEAINSLCCPIVSVDIPSGLDCDTGRTLGVAIKADCTVTFVAMKKGFVFESAQAQTGEIYIASIGVEPGSRQN
jgi:NAD(P)H-hydrate epimerase